ncbi:hypothetical protein SAMN05444392_101560 [Seinonella peptonophila]|uniref:Uncharacterized protein n=1 Tax=Seinonella peptonophila TaxID=112248 RepID=A0A1M4TNX6_9BACL|nr:hypothetical protein [Seinonella peptonophila]SHE46095.1 hypothetical protein SAMN05444392_101560 [Seinonella peptonophila]
MSTFSTTQKGWHFLVLALFAIGFIVELIQHPISIILPLVLIGVIYYLYKFPPAWLIRLSTRTDRRFIHPRSQPQKAINKRAKKHSFRVINGKKKRSL